MTEFSSQAAPGGTMTIRRLASKLYHEPGPRTRFIENMKALITLSPALARASSCSNEVVTRAALGLPIDYEDAVQLVKPFNTRVLTLLTEDVARRAAHR